MSEYTDEQFAKLPRWAQTLIKVQEGTIERLNRNVAQMSDPNETPIKWRQLLDDWHGIPNGTSVRFHTDIGAWVDARIDDDHLILHGSREFAIEPQSSNSIHVYVRR